MYNKMYNKMSRSLRTKFDHSIEGSPIITRVKVKEQLKHEFYITSFGLDDSERVKIEQDPEVIKAIESMPKAKQLLDSSKKQIVQRMVHQDRAE